MNNVWTTLVMLAYCFTPLVVTLTALFCVWLKRTAAARKTRPDMDGPGWLLASAVRWMPEERREWGRAMMTELAQCQGVSLRWRFAMSCVRAALSAPPRDGRLHYMLAKQSSACGVLAVMLPPLGWPFMLLATAVFEIIGGSPFTQSSRWSNPAMAMAIWHLVKLLTMACFLAGLPLGLAGLWRGESRRWLSVMGIISTCFAIVWFLLLDLR